MNLIRKAVNWATRKAQSIPFEWRARTYRVLAIAGAAGVAAGKLTDDDVATALEFIGAVLGVTGTTLAAANTPTLRAFKRRA